MSLAGQSLWTRIRKTLVLDLLFGHVRGNRGQSYVNVIATSMTIRIFDQRMLLLKLSVDYYEAMSLAVVPRGLTYRTSFDGMGTLQIRKLNFQYHDVGQE